MRWLYAIVSWGIVALGLAHMLTTLALFKTLTTNALWFFSGGIVLVLTGTINLLNRAYGHTAPGLRVVCIGTNIFMLAFGLVSGVVGRSGVVGFVLVLGLIGGATFLSSTRRSLLR